MFMMMLSHKKQQLKQSRMKIKRLLYHKNLLMVLLLQEGAVGGEKGSEGGC